MCAEAGGGKLQQCNRRTTSDKADTHSTIPPCQVTMIGSRLGHLFAHTGSEYFQGVLVVASASEAAGVNSCVSAPLPRCRVLTTSLCVCPTRSWPVDSWYSRCALHLDFVDEFAVIETLPLACVVIPAVVITLVKIARDVLKWLQGLQRARRRASSVGSGSTSGVSSPVSQLSPLAAAGVASPTLPNRVRGLHGYVARCWRW